MNKQDMLKTQTCVLRVNVHCDGCEHKIKKKLQKIEGVYEVRIDVEEGKVTVSGNVDPATLIKKLDKAGKHAELWGPQKRPTPTMNLHTGKEITRQNGGFQATQHKNELRDVRFLGKDQKSGKLRLSKEEEDDDSDEDDDQFDDEFDEGFAARQQPPTKAHGAQANNATPKGHPKGKTGSNNGRKSKKGSGMNMFFKGILGKAGGKSDRPSPRKTQNKAANQDGGGKTSYKNGAVNGKGASAHKNYNDSWSKKVGENFDASRKLEDQQMQQGFNEMNTRYRGGGGGGKTGPMGQVGNFWGGNTGSTGGQMGNFWGGNTGPMGSQMGDFRGGNAGLMGGQMGNFEGVRGLQPATAMSAGNFQGNPYNQQYMAHMMMMMNQQRDDSYMRPQPAMSYGPPPMADQYTHIFNDENTSSCSIM